MRSTLLASVALLCAMPVAAQADQTAAPDDDYAPADIIVTATKRAQALSDVPIAVSAITAESLQNSGASDIDRKSVV